MSSPLISLKLKIIELLRLCMTLGVVYLYRFLAYHKLILLILQVTPLPLLNKAIFSEKMGPSCIGKDPFIVL